MHRPIVHICTVPTPYRNAEWDTAAAGVGAEQVALIFVNAVHDTACWRPQFPRLCPYYCLDSPAELNGVPGAQLGDLLVRLDPRAVIVSGYLQPAYRQTLRWCLARGVPYCLRSASSIWSDDEKGYFRYLVRRWRLGGWVRHADRCLITGKFNRQFWQRYGMKPAQEGWFPQWIDYDNFLRGRELRSGDRAALRRELGIDAPLTVFFAGRLLRYKRVHLLCEALLRLDDRVALVVAGHGEQEQPLRAAYQQRLGDRLRLLGDLEPDELARWYAATDVYALPSGPEEIWGHVITEAATVGMPILCHARLGAAGDLLVDGHNGIAVNSHDPTQWARALTRLADDPQRVVDMGTASAELADRWRERSNPADCVRQLLNAYPA